jgi:hypothetical protein
MAIAEFLDTLESNLDLDISSSAISFLERLSRSTFLVANREKHVELFYAPGLRGGREAPMGVFARGKIQRETAVNGKSPASTVSPAANTPLRFTM